MSLKCKTFSATKARDRESLGETVTAFLRSPEVNSIIDRQVMQSSDSEFHCLSIIIWYS